MKLIQTIGQVDMMTVKSAFLSLPNSQLSIYYAQRCANDMAEKGEAFDPWNDGCPVLQQVYDAETRILKKHASWLFGEGGQCGFNFSLNTYKINL